MPDQARDPARWPRIHPSSTILESNPNHRQAMKPSNYRDRWMMNAAGSAQFPGNPRLFLKPQGHGAPSLRAAGSPQHLQHLGPGSQVLPCDKPVLPFAFLPVKYRSYFPSTRPPQLPQPNQMALLIFFTLLTPEKCLTCGHHLGEPFPSSGSASADSHLMQRCDCLSANIEILHFNLAP